MLEFQEDGTQGNGGAMKKQRHTEEQISIVLKQVELGAPAGDVCRKIGVTEQTFYRWKAKYGSMLPSDIKRLRQL
jgi:putative transposase